MTPGNFQITVMKFIDRVSKYSLIYYIVMTISLILLQMDIFNEHVPINYLVNGVIAFNTFTIGTSVLDKILKRNKPDPKPFLYCPECENAKMRTSGEWICEKCTKIFGQPRKENNSSKD